MKYYAVIYLSLLSCMHSTFGIQQETCCHLTLLFFWLIVSFAKEQNALKPLVVEHIEVFKKIIKSCLTTEWLIHILGFPTKPLHKDMTRLLSKLNNSLTISVIWVLLCYKYSVFIKKECLINISTWQSELSFGGPTHHTQKLIINKPISSLLHEKSK